MVLGLTFVFLPCACPVIPIPLPHTAHRSIDGGKTYNPVNVTVNGSSVHYDWRGMEDRPLGGCMDFSLLLYGKHMDPAVT